MSIQRTGFSKDETRLAVSVKTARTMLDIGNTKLWELIGNGQLKTIKIGRKRLIVYSSLVALIEQ
jgi:excisionase family DNA binding protein